MCSAVRLFCFLIGMVFQQNSSLLLLVNLLFVLTICKGVRFARGKLPRITQACGIGDLRLLEIQEWGGVSQIQPGAERLLTSR